jgi:CelD/BcsL family acetyltransferase involved in cellulose biosynthesis
VGDERWLDLVSHDPDATIFHRAEWLTLLRDQYGYEPSAWALAAPEGQLVAGLPVVRVRSRLTSTRLVAVPFSDVCRPVVLPGRADTVARLAQVIAGEHERLGLDLEVRAELPNAPGGQLAGGHVLHELRLSADVDEVYSRFPKPQLRQHIKKARKSGLVAERRVDRDGLAAFYALHLRTRRRLGVPTQPRSFVLALERLFAAGLGFVQLVRLEGKPVGGAVFLVTNGTLTYKYSALDVEYRRLGGGHLILIEGIEWGCEHGCQTLDMGRTEEDNEGLRAFKRSWGAEEIPLAYTHFGSVRRVGGGNGPLARLASAVIRRSPAFVGRLAGEALYRHAG